MCCTTAPYGMIYVPKHERDPESGTIARVHYQPPVELRKPIRIEKQTAQQEDFTLSSVLFAVK